MVTIQYLFYFSPHFRMDGATVSKVLAEKWKSMNSDDQQQFYQEAERLKNLHQIQHPNYKYTPKARRMGMKKSMARIDPSALVETTYGPPATSGINITGTGNPVPQIAGTYLHTYIF